VQFYFGDERCVPPDHHASNYGMAMGTLFPNGMPKGVQSHRMEADGADVEAAANRYAALLPETIDVLLLSVGEDGHIASLFPHGAALRETVRRVVPVTGPKPPFQRLTITSPVIQSARHVFVMALGEQKRAVYEEALRDPEDIDSIPARLVLNRTWIFDDD
jgi:6-phosphogluconolactonase